MKRNSLAIVITLTLLPMVAIAASYLAAARLYGPPIRPLSDSSTCGTGNSGTGNPGPVNSGTGNSGQPCQFTVTGSIPVTPSLSQSTWTTGLTCNGIKEEAAQDAGATAVRAYKLGHMPQSAALLSHFLSASGSAINYPDGSGISDALKKDQAFTNLEAAVNAQIASDLSKGITNIVLKKPVIYTLTIGKLIGNTGARELYFGFRGTQGLQISGGGTYSGTNYNGHLTYVIQDSYGFTPKDTVLGMRYLQTNCGTPPNKGGAHWFPDSINADIHIHNP